MTSFAISHNSRDSTQRDDEQAVTDFFQSRGFAVRKLDQKKNVGENPDLELSKKDKGIAIVEVKSRFGSDLHSITTDKINKALENLKFGYYYFIEHKYRRPPNQNEIEQITDLISGKIEKLERSENRISFPHVIWLGKDEDLSQYLRNIHSFYNSHEMPKETWIEMMTRNYWDVTRSFPLLVTLESENTLGHLRCDGSVPNMDFNRLNYFKGRVDKAKAQLKKYDQDIPKGIIFVGHGIVGGSYSDAMALYGEDFDLIPICPDCRIMKVNLHNSGILGRNSNNWLSFFGFFEALQEVPPRLEIFRNCYAATKLVVDHFKVENSQIYSFVDTDDDSILFLFRNVP